MDILEELTILHVSGH